MLEENGLFLNMIDAVMPECINAINELAPTYPIKWNRPASEYPEGIYNVWFVVIKPVVLKWLNANAPQAWFKSIFE